MKTGWFRKELLNQ